MTVTVIFCNMRSKAAKNTTAFSTISFFMAKINYRDDIMNYLGNS